MTSVSSSHNGNLSELGPDLGDAERMYVFSVAMKYVKDEEAAADVTQEALLSAHRHRKSFRGDSRYSTWLYRIACTSALMYLRKKRRRSREVMSFTDPGDEDHAVNQEPSESCPPDRHMANRQALEVIERRLAELGDKYQRIFWMRYLEGYTESEIAAHLDLTLATVKTRAHRARVAVRESLRAAA